MGLKCQLVKDWFLLNFMDFSIISNISLALPLSPGFIVSPSFLHWLPDLFCRRGYCYFLLHLKKKLVRGCIILIYAGFLQTKVSVYVGVYFPSLGFFSLHLCFFFFLVHLSEKPDELKSVQCLLAFAVFWVLV